MTDIDSTAAEKASPDAKGRHDHLQEGSGLSRAARHVDIIHTSLAGMTAMMVMLLIAVALPVLGYKPVTNMGALVAIAIAVVAGMAYLYYLNFAVYRIISDHSRLTEVLVNSLGQAFLSFNQKGVCDRVFSQACQDLLETLPPDKNITDVLRIEEDKKAEFRDWVDVLYMSNHALGFDDVVPFLPQFFPHSQGRRISLNYRPMRDSQGNLVQVVVIATDRTEEYEAQQQVQQQQGYAEMICRVFKEHNQFHATITHIRKFLEATENPVSREEASPLLRELHTLKAAVKHFHLDRLGNIVSQLETDLRGDGINSDAEFYTILMAGRSEIHEALVELMKQMHELVGSDFEHRGKMHEVEEEELYLFAASMIKAKVSDDLMKRFLINILAVPLNDCFRQFERELHDLADVTGKQVKPIRYTGVNPRILTRQLQDFLFSLTHICRNIIDHAIELPMTRLARSKDPAGQISVHSDIITDGKSGEQKLKLIISDDGNGIDPSRVRAKLATIEPNGDWLQEDDHAVIQRIFSWGFSTRDTVTDLSGRGVGMEAVEREVSRLGGKIEVFSELYHGTRFEITVPYSIDITPLL